MQGQLTLRTSYGRLLALAFGVAVTLLLSGTAGYWLRAQAPALGATQAAPAITQVSAPYDGPDPAIQRGSQATNSYDGRDPARP